MKTNELKNLAVEKLMMLKRNPQYLTPKQMDSLKASIERDGFVAPILVRPLSKGQYEVVSGNHRLMAARELGIANVPCVVAKLDRRSAQRLAVNLNLIHGNPNVELLAPFLAELDDQTLSEIHIEADMKVDLIEFDEHLADALSRLEPPDGANHNSPTTEHVVCRCEKCGGTHIVKHAKENV